MCVNNLSKAALDSAAAGIEPAISTPVTSPTPDHYATEPHSGSVVRTSVFGRQTFPAMRPIYGWQVTTLKSTLQFKKVKLMRKL